MEGTKARHQLGDKVREQSGRRSFTVDDTNAGDKLGDEVGDRVRGKVRHTVGDKSNTKQ